MENKTLPESAWRNVLPRACGTAALAAASAGGTAHAERLSEALALDIVATGVYQAGELEPASDEDELTGVVDGTLTFQPSDADTFSATASFAENNALNDEAPVSLAPFADDLEDDLENISNRDRDYLLTAWYRRSMNFSGQSGVAVTAGLIDTTAYLDQNAYANDEVGQFMNDIFVNNTLLNLPSYDLGAAAEVSLAGDWSANAVWFNGQVDRADGDEGFNYFGGQVGWHPEFALGEGNYRAIAYTTDENFAGNESGDERLAGAGLSLDQALGEVLGVFARAGWQDEDAAVDHDAHVSGGLQVSGHAWERPQDTAGIGLAHLSGAEGSGIDRTYATEAYFKVGLAPALDVTLGAQYIEDDLIGEPDAEALIGSLRVNIVY